MSSGNMLPPKAQMVLARDFVVRRSELTVPGHSMKMMAKAAASNADQVMFDLEDACAVSQKVEARKTVIEAFNTLDFGGKIRAFRPNNIRTRFFYRDLIEVVEAAGRNIDVIVIPELCSGCGKCLPACPVDCIYDDPQPAATPEDWWELPMSQEDPYVRV